MVRMTIYVVEMNWSPCHYCNVREHVQYALCNMYIYESLELLKSLLTECLLLSLLQRDNSWGTLNLEKCTEFALDLRKLTRIVYFFEL